MTDCSAECPYEVRSVDNRSPGPIGSTEMIFRGSYDPMHYKKGKLQTSFVKNADLVNGQLSVWRSSELADCTPVDIIDIVSGFKPSGNHLKAIHGATAQSIREIYNPSNNKRFFCVVDETETDDKGGTHRAHAHIKFCDSQVPLISDTTGPDFVSAKRQLVFLLKQIEVPAD